MYYVWVHATPSKRAISRLLAYGSFASAAVVAGAAVRRPDVILASSPPLSVGVVGACLAARHRRPWVLDVRDLWPDAPLAVGQMREGRLFRLAQRLESRLYASASAITTTTEPFRNRIAERGGGGKVSVLANGTTSTFLEAGIEPPEPTPWNGADRRFTWTYAGNLGLVADLNSAVRAAGELGHGFQLALVGAGPRRDELESLAAPLPEGTVVFHDAVPPERAARLMRASDALLVSQAPLERLEGMVLSKLYDCCAVARPIVVAAIGETRRLADEAGAALCVPPGDPTALADAIRRLRDDASLGEGLARRARQFAEANSRDRWVTPLEKTLNEAASI